MAGPTRSSRGHEWLETAERLRWRRPASPLFHGSASVDQVFYELSGRSGRLVAVYLHQFTVPSYLLFGLPAGTGGVALQNYVYSTITASGLDEGLAVADVFYKVGSTTFK